MFIAAVSSIIKQAADGFRLYYVVRDGEHSEFKRESFPEPQMALLRWRVLFWQATGKTDGRPRFRRADNYAI